MTDRNLENWKRVSAFRDEDYRNDNPNLGAWNNALGTNYGAGKFSGKGYGEGMEADKYRGYYADGNPSSGFADQYRRKYGGSDPDMIDRVYGMPFLSFNQEGVIRPELNYSDDNGNRGKGPRGYRRSDDRIYEDVNDRLYEDSYIDATDIDVKVENGNVILSGDVESRWTKRRAEEVAESVTGVINVENRLHVRRGIVKDFTRAITAGITSGVLGYERDKGL